MRAQAGFTLIELMIALVVVAILAAVAVPSYRQYVIRSQRTDATESLLRLATAQEKFYLQNNRYADNDEMDDAPPAGLGITGSGNGWYTLSVVAADATTFTVRAVPTAGERQANDDDCARFEVDDRGVRTALDSGGDDNTAECWR
jgi:type IV pilus assembly protein PilE